MKRFNLKSNQLFSILPILIILLVALVVRLHGINYGLPYLYDADEFIYVENILRMIGEASIDPEYFATPSQTTIYFTAIAYLLTYVVGNLMGSYQSLQEFIQLYQQDPTIFYVIARTIISLFDVMTVLLVYLIGQRLFSRNVGLLAAALLAVIPIHAATSRVIRPDIQMTFFIVLVFWLCLNIVDRPTTRNYFLAGFALAFAVLSKYPGAAALVLIGAAHLMVTKDLFNIRSHFKLIVSGLGGILGVIVCSPLFLLNLRSAYIQFRGQNSQNLLSVADGGVLGSVAYYLQSLVTNDLAVMGFLLLLVAAFFLLRSKKPRNILLLGFPILFMIAISMVSLRYNRYILPSLPFFAIIVAYGFVTIVEYLQQRLNKYLALSVTGILLFVLIFPLASKTIIAGNELAGPDTRTVARQWIIDNLPPNSKLLMEFYAPQLPFGTFDYYGGHWSGETTLSPLIPEDFSTDFVIARNILGRFSADQAFDHDIDYVIMTEFYDRFLELGDDYLYEIQNYETLMENGELIYSIEPIPGYQSGPPISIYALDRDAQE